MGEVYTEMRRVKLVDTRDEIRQPKAKSTSDTGDHHQNRRAYNAHAEKPKPSATYEIFPLGRVMLYCDYFAAPKHHGNATLLYIYTNSHIHTSQPSLSLARFSMSAVFLMAFAAAPQSFFSIASRAKGKTLASRPLLRLGAKTTCLYWSRLGS
jgi:hypothetical protein